MSVINIGFVYELNSNLVAITPVKYTGTLPVEQSSFSVGNLPAGLTQTNSVIISAEVLQSDNTGYTTLHDVYFYMNSANSISGWISSGSGFLGKPYIVAVMKVS